MSAWADEAQTIASTLDFRVQAPAGTYGSANVELLLSYQLTAKTDNGQLREVSLTAAPTDVLGALSGGSFQATYTVDPATQLFRMIHAQARIETSPGVYDYTNRVVVFVGLQRPLSGL